VSIPDGAPVQPGDILAGKYRVEKVLGTGAMGVVVAAMHVELHERRAIKFMLPSMLGDAEGVERFLREARAAVRLKSQHVARIHDIGRLETGAPYTVMEYLEGGDLKALLDARGPLPVTEAVAYVLQACEAIAEAHALGIIHRDLKPANLFVTTGVGGAPFVKVLDFGIAKVISAQGPVDMTRTSGLLGTPLYMSPEQMRSARNVDARTDIWALGAILYRMLTGRTPFLGSSVTEICAAVSADPPDPPSLFRPDLPPAFEAVILRCLEKSPARRFATAAELATALAPFATPLQASAASWARPADPPGPLQAAAPARQASAPGISAPATPTPASAHPMAATAHWPMGPVPASHAAGISTAQASSWTKLAAPSPASAASVPRSPRGARVLIAAIVGILVIVAGAYAVVQLSGLGRNLGRGSRRGAADEITTAPIPASEIPTTVPGAPATVPTATASATAMATASATAMAMATASATATASTTPTATASAPASAPRPVLTGALPRSTAAATPKDAFGNERK
jgi:serine/threonine-protein kinase